MIQDDSVHLIQNGLIGNTTLRSIDSPRKSRVIVILNFPRLFDD